MNVSKMKLLLFGTDLKIYLTTLFSQLITPIFLFNRNKTELSLTQLDSRKQSIAFYRLYTDRRSSSEMAISI